MPTKLNSYILHDNTIDTMKEMISETKQDKLERQFDFCHNPKTNILIPENRCIGNVCSVTSRKTCIGTEKFIGTYHTHPEPFSEKPSSGDLFNIQGEGMGCVGSAFTNRIRCYIFKAKEKDYEYIKEVNKDLEKIDDIELEIERKIIDKTGKTKESWQMIARKEDSLKEKDKVINKYFRIYPLN